MIQGKGKRKYYLIEQMGGVWSMSITKFRAFLRAGKKGDYPDAGDYGKHGGYIDHTVTDYEPEDFATELERIQ